MASTFNKSQEFYVTKEQYETLISVGYIIVGDVQYNYDPNATYFVRDDLDLVIMEDND